MLDPVSLEKELKKRLEIYWIRRGEKMALGLFHKMAQRVPAYKNFLKQNKIDPRKIKTIADFKKVPTIDKDNYLRANRLESLCWDGDFRQGSWVISATSGSTGEPFYFPRQSLQDDAYSLTLELFLRANFNIGEKRTLFVVGFPMGVWIGGVFTYQALKNIADKGYNLSIITPGINKQEILKAIKNLRTDFDQILIGSYGPFLKDVLDDAESFGINLKDYSLGFVFAAEGFSEEFRDYITAKAGLKNPCKDTINIYGTADLGTMAHETPLSVFIRRKAVADQKIYHMLFGQTTKLPTLCQYIPELFFFEDIEGRLVCSSYSGIPLVRYDLKDNGGILSFDKTAKNFPKNGEIFDTAWNLPFVYVYERSDFSVSFFAFQIYPETVKRALLDKGLEKHLTGKFTMTVKFDKDVNQYLEINVELKKDLGHNENLDKLVQKKIMEKLTSENSEYKKTAEEYPDKVVPKIVFWEYENKEFFSPGIKQKWIKK